MAAALPIAPTILCYRLGENTFGMQLHFSFMAAHQILKPHSKNPDEKKPSLFPQTALKKKCKQKYKYFKKQENNSKAAKVFTRNIHPDTKTMRRAYKKLDLLLADGTQKLTPAEVQADEDMVLNFTLINHR
ncbi:hypothetical protein PGT21_017356 [Puccinia graminis f. sp. tritici]|uniref:Uncharacterized protein n=2 Tax=Puccinia graminis f. sp. tritici TaxID=56615 RepID=A0A5B0QWG4_PUCGR|nr:hypothetical protein PGT21_017356 [Puccinia graminis f. sp. tritici]